MKKSMKVIKNLALVLLAILALSSCSNAADSGWKQIKLLDEFGQDTGETTIGLETDGTFSNSATANGKLKVKIQYTESIYVLNIYEYGDLPVSFDTSARSEKIDVKRENGDIEQYDAMFMKSYGFLFKDDEGLGKLINEGKGENLTLLIKAKKYESGNSAVYTIPIKARD